MAKTNSELLYNVSQKSARKIIGLMSGASLDGLDIALCTFKNSGVESEISIDNFKTIPYTLEVKKEIQNVFAKTKVKFQNVCILNAWLGQLHGKMIKDCLESWNVLPANIDLIASHGQTVYHAPKSQHGITNRPNATLQIGDADHIAVTTGIITISDFRQKHVAAGGEGAPLALYGDFFIFSKKHENRIMLNIGGISNITCLYGDLNARKAFATDLGPGNTLIDAVARKYFNKDFDEDGEFAKSGQVNKDLLDSLKQHDFFSSLPFPKTTGPELFNLKFVRQAQKSSKTETILPTDLVATLTRFTAVIIVDGILNIDEIESFVVYGSGGGIHNPVLMDHLRNLLPQMVIKSTDELGIPGDAKESVLFATLANEMVCGKRTYFGDRPGIPSVMMGKISFPG